MTFDGVGIDIQHDFPVDPDVVAPRMRAAERLGFDGIWIIGGIRAGIPAPMETLAFAAGITNRISLGLAVLVSPLFTPLHVARSALTLDRLSQGRLILGLGLGHGGDSYRRHGIATPPHRGHHFEQGILAIASLLRNETTDAEDPPLHDEPRPLEPSRPGSPPLWIGGHAEAALDRAARLGDGWLGAGAMPIDAFYPALETLRARLDAHGRDSSQFVLGKRVMVHVGERDSSVAERLGAWFGRGTGDPSRAERVVVHGTPDDVIAGLSKMREHGAHALVLTPLFDVDEQMARLATEVCPHLPPAAL
ncbi:MAG: LLM class flavin-dependent oxidoreductase [Acidimicrobiales bacterium]